MATRERSAPASGAAAFAGLLPALESMPAGMRSWMEDVERLRAESQRFVLDRFDKDARLAAALAACRQPKQFVDLQAAGLRECASDYLHESVRLSSIAVQAWRHGLDWLGAAAAAARPRAQ